MLLMGRVQNLIRSLAGWLNEDHMWRLGIDNTMRLAGAYDRLRFRRLDAWRRWMYRTQLPALLDENGGCARPPIELHDGWAIDTSKSLPHLDRVLADADQIIAERAGARTTSEGAYRSYFQDMWKMSDAEKYPSFLDFATSSDIVAAVSHRLQCIPALSNTVPSPVRFVESNAAFDDQPDCPHDSQLYHIDYHCLPNVYVLVLLRDTTFENGPWTFLPKSVSQQAKKALGYGKRSRGYRVSDGEIYSVVDRREAIEFSYPRGTVLFIESSGCFHYGSRNSVKPRFQLMYGYTGACRTDLTELFMKPKVFPTRETDSRLRKMLLDKNTIAKDASSRSGFGRLFSWPSLRPRFGRAGVRGGHG